MTQHKNAASAEPQKNNAELILTLQKGRQMSAEKSNAEPKCHEFSATLVGVIGLEPMTLCL